MSNKEKGCPAQGNAVAGSGAQSGRGRGSSCVAGMDRRTFVLGTCGAAAMLALGGAFCASVPADVLLPPGVQDVKAMLSRCIRCMKCMEACPEGVIVPAHVEDGLFAARAPKLDFSRSSIALGGRAGWCDHCQQSNGGVACCAEVCPTGALGNPRQSSFRTMQLGVARIDEQSCLAWNLKGCTVCVNACPLGAITADEHGRPSVDGELCNGCGACEQACVSLESTSVGEGSSSRLTNRRAVTVERCE